MLTEVLIVKKQLSEEYFEEKFFFLVQHQHQQQQQLPPEQQERIEGLKRYKPPEFAYTGTLRPSYITPVKAVPDSIDKPDYASGGVPLSENRFHRTTPNKIPIYTPQDIEGIRLACKLGMFINYKTTTLSFFFFWEKKSREVLDIAASVVRPGITTDEIDVAVHEACIERGCYPSPLNYNGFLKSCCTSVNEVVCHGIPDCRPLEDGDIVNVDISVYKDGYHADLNETFTVGRVEQKYKDLIKVAHDSLAEAIKHGSFLLIYLFIFFIYLFVYLFIYYYYYQLLYLGEIIDNYVSKYGFTPNRTYCGHGIGMMFHCPPNIPHYKKNKAIGKAKPGMVFTIEPMINIGQWKDKIWTFDHWTVVTVDGQRSAQFEHTLLVTEDGCEVLTARTSSSPPLWWELEPPAPTNSVEEKTMDVDLPNTDAQNNASLSSRPASDSQSEAKTAPDSEPNNTEQTQKNSNANNNKNKKKRKP
ncbi:methionine aminopeptidase [Reticulomyxa filosa]|uniref:Methionine aminopeptidase n=1 Tax=Reticulomyxa filosa TaxID=46433 RepID=X6MTV0_RETFI|nr:methionine aminopeptidase [Reticulomyxa filosa]|eukprot:ETO16550.1 methionine aminopeptidase [Reticulomyxa filosa]